MKKYLSLVKFSHTIFALPFALVGLFLGFQTARMYTPDWKLLGLVVLCMVFARTAAMAFNRYIDRHIDARNERTKGREIPAGKLSAKAVLVFVILNSILFMATAYFINWLCFLLSPVALLVVLGYSYTKRFTAFCHLVLGLGLALAPVGAFLAVTAEFQLEPIILGFVVLTWVSGFDIIYALQDQEFDKEEKLRSIPVALGKWGGMIMSIILHLFTAAALIFFGMLIQGGILFWIGAMAFISLLSYQHFIVSPNDLSRVNIAFFTTNGVASVVFAVFAISDLVMMMM